MPGRELWVLHGSRGGGCVMGVRHLACARPPMMSGQVGPLQPDSQLADVHSCKRRCHLLNHGRISSQKLQPIQLAGT